ncbi:PREDICTED: protein PIN-LIKES 3 isoform X2 [Theobroma cacao]|nr:PREDICTED: protein PIN-LIKES 3 isoform X2 [Theobroma cacao]XP_017985173.1 PREDICTED: protein PIN-LIKES 3 isoform X2 [Theobroma cacao]XP_017985174.1 PREDICTED: protein PIN-LIKES 3 isoform X2 [Theobroma cacao]EOY18969.1 Auxin efflux carrier family protein [Theobroma cacao]
MGFLDLFVVAVMPVLKVLLVTGVGLFLATDGINLLGPEARNYLNKIVFYLFGPSLVVSNLAETVTLESLVTMWFMPVNIFLTFIIGSALGWILIKITKTPEHLRGMVIGCCSAGNLGNLLLIIVPAVCTESNTPFGDSCSTYAEAYASLSMAVGAIFIWSYAYPFVYAYASKSMEQNSSEGAPQSFPDSCTEALLPSRDCSNSEDYSGQGVLPLTNSDKRIKMSVVKKTVESIKIIMGKIDLKRVFAPSAIAAVVGFIIGTISPIRKVLIGDNAPLHVIDTSVSLIAEAAIPCMTLIMGANLLKGLKRSEVSMLVIIGIVAVRNIFLPLSGIGVVKAAHHFGMVGSDSLYRFVLMLQYAVPPAMSVGTMTQLFQSGQGESSMIMLWTYAVASISLTLWSMLFMWLLS